MKKALEHRLAQSIFLSHCYNQTPDRKQLKVEKSLATLGLKVQFIMAGKAWQCERLMALGAGT